MVLRSDNFEAECLLLTHLDFAEIIIYQVLELHIAEVGVVVRWFYSVLNEDFLF